MTQRVAEDAVPAIERGQLLRSGHQIAEEPCDPGQRVGRPLAVAVRAGDPQRGLTGVADECADAGEPQAAGW